MRSCTWLAGAMVLSASLRSGPHSGPTALAQPDPNNPPKSTKPIARPGAIGRDPATLEAERRRLEERIRQLLTRAGFVEPATQEAVAAHAAEQDKAKRALTLKGSALLRDVRGLRGAPPPDEQVAATLAEYRTAVAQYQTQRKEAAAALEAKIHYSKNPRLESLLMLTGLIGDGPLLLSPLSTLPFPVGAGGNKTLPVQPRPDR